MAKKIKLENEIENVQIEEAVIVIDEMPTDLVEIKKEYGLKLEDSKVEAHIITYLPFFKQLLDLEKELELLLLKEPNAETVEEASALRKKYLKIRTGAKNQKDIDKADIVTEGRFLDAVNKRIEAAAQLKEDKCKEIEQHLANLEAKRKEDLSKKRSELLDSVDYGDSSFLPLGDMSDESFDRLYQKQKKAKEDADFKAQADAKEQEEAKAFQDRTNARIAKLVSVGMVYAPIDEDPENMGYSNDSYDITIDFLQKVSDDKFDQTFKVISDEFKAEQDAKAEKQKAEKEKAERKVNRINALTSLGMLWDAEKQSYLGFDRGIDLTTINDSESEDFKKLYEEIKKHIEGVKAAKKAKEDQDKAKKDKDAADLKKKNEDLEAEKKRLQDEEAARKKKESDDAAAKAKAEQDALLAPDKEKFKSWYKEHLLAARDKFPELTSETGIAVKKVMLETLAIVINGAKGEAGRFL